MTDEKVLLMGREEGLMPRIRSYLVLAGWTFTDKGWRMDYPGTRERYFTLRRAFEAQTALDRGTVKTIEEMNDEAVDGRMASVLMQGREAAQAGEAAFHNPYTKESRWHDTWNEGWTAWHEETTGDLA